MQDHELQLGSRGLVLGAQQLVVGVMRQGASPSPSLPRAGTAHSVARAVLQLASLPFTVRRRQAWRRRRATTRSPRAAQELPWLQATPPRAGGLRRRASRSRAPAAHAGRDGRREGVHGLMADSESQSNQTHARSGAGHIQARVPAARDGSERRNEDSLFTSFEACNRVPPRASTLDGAEMVCLLKARSAVSVCRHSYCRISMRTPAAPSAVAQARCAGRIASRGPLTSASMALRAPGAPPPATAPGRGAPRASRRNRRPAGA